MDLNTLLESKHRREVMRALQVLRRAHSVQAERTIKSYIIRLEIQIDELEKELQNEP